MNRRTPKESEILVKVDIEFNKWLKEFTRVTDVGLKKWYDYLVSKYGLPITEEIIAAEIMPMTKTFEFSRSGVNFGPLFTQVDFIFAIVLCILSKFTPNDLSYLRSEFEEIGFGFGVSIYLYYGIFHTIARNACITLNELLPHLNMYEVMRKLYLDFYKIFM